MTQKQLLSTKKSIAQSELTQSIYQQTTFKTINSITYQYDQNQYK